MYSASAILESEIYGLTGEALRIASKTRNRVIANKPKSSDGKFELMRNKHGSVRVKNLPSFLKEIHDTLSQRANEIRQKYGLDQFGNVGIAEININGIISESKAYSGFNNLYSLRCDKPTIEDGFASQVKEEDRHFKVLFLNSAQDIDYIKGWDRSVCTESKIMEDIARKLGNNLFVEGTINLFTEDVPCKSCRMVFEQFSKRYPNIKIKVFSNSLYYDRF